MTQSVGVEDRRREEDELLDRWYEALSAALGGAPQGFGPDDVWREYRRSALVCTVYAVVAGGSMDPANERGRQLVTTISQRAFTAALDLDAADLLP